jgi:3-phytase
MHFMFRRTAGILASSGVLALSACTSSERRSELPAVGVEDSVAVRADASLPVSPDTLQPAVITDTVPGDSDDPAIWINPADPARSVVLGTDKGDSTGGVYVFDLTGHIDRARSVTPLRRMNNVDIAYGLDVNGKPTDVAVATERNRMAIRVFSLPQMKAIDGGGLAVMDGDSTRAPMGIALYRRPRDGALYAIVGGKSGPKEGYLIQYRLQYSSGQVQATKVRTFGTWSGKKEIEAIVVDAARGYVYYSDETVGVRKYYVDPDSSTRELALFATSGVVSDHEGLAIYARDDSTGYILLSDQQGHRVQVFPREGTASSPHAHPVIAVLPVRAQETDGLEVTSKSLGPAFPRGMLVMMSNRGAFHYYRWEDVEAAIEKVHGTPPPK